MDWVERLLFLGNNSNAQESSTLKRVLGVGRRGFIVSVVLWVLYYWFRVRKNPKLFYLRTENNERIVKGCPSLFKPYSPPIYCVNGHLQLLVFWLRGKLTQPLKWRRETLTLADQGQVTLDWAPDSNFPNDFEEPDVLHGLAGGSEDFADFARKGVAQGFRVIVYNRRGHSKVPLTTKRLTAFGDAQDFKEVLNYLVKRLPNSPLYAMGVSAGSGVLVSYLGEVGADAPLQGAAAVSPGYDIVEFLLGRPNLTRSEELRRQRGEKGRLWDSKIHPFYDKFMMGNWKRFLRQHIDHFEDVVSWKDIEACATYSEYESKFGWQLCGFESFEAYLQSCNPMRGIKNVGIPLLTISALDDPVCKKDLIYYDIFVENEHAVLATTDYGSHTSFLTGFFSWKDEVVLEYLQSVENMAMRKSNNKNNELL